MTKYNCSSNRWLRVLSSQRSETTNRSLKRRLRATADLCDFYNIFCDVVSEWRSKENGEDHKFSKGTAEMIFPSINILKHALSVYTIEAFLMFEKEFIDGASYNYKEVDSSTSDRVLHACCVNQVPDQYVMKRWCKGIKDGQNLELGISTRKEPMVCSSIWKTQMMRKMNSLITASQSNMNARDHCEKYFTELKKLIEFDVGSIYFEEDGQEKNLNLPQNVLNPPSSC
ncbi:hypothetical protein Cgig2_027278 [Carnegiea gigantea]|uniref:Protein FAR1-RELATED SEQUENCE n=1 Tax=Carnegiea gigantea TaxID=171969 RepID=A0A9Q1QB36_9CARY|nr:hypothetical protein Cgig2_027278 [Carnegiea gigantea]